MASRDIEEEFLILAQKLTCNAKLPSGFPPSRFEDPASVRDALERVELEVEFLRRADSYA